LINNENDRFEEAFKEKQGTGSEEKSRRENGLNSKAGARSPRIKLKLTIKIIHEAEQCR